MGKALVIRNVSFQNNALDQVTIIDPIPCTEITLSESTATFEYIGDNVTITATLVPADTTEQVIWESSNANVASVIDGVITLKGLGTATITATCGSVSATVSVTQSSAKIEDYFIKVNSQLAKRSNTYPNLVMYSDNTFGMVGKEYDLNDEICHVEGGSERGIEAIIVPAGANYVSLVIEDSSTHPFKVTAGDPINRTLYNGTLWPTYVSDSASYGTKLSVTPGQVIMLRLQDSTGDLDGITGVQFSVS